MATLLLRLAGPMQSWGTQSKFRHRDTGLEPSKSGVIGLLCAALGRPRDEPVDDLSNLRMGVRVDREGIVKVDYHTVGAGYIAGRLPGAHTAFPPSGREEMATLSHRSYLADASFLVGLEGPMATLQALDAALRSPVWQIFLGRKAFPPGAPVRLPDGLRDQSLEEALDTYPLDSEMQLRRYEDRRRDADRQDDADRIRLVIEDPSGAETRNDVPISFAQRTFAGRTVQTQWKELVR